MPIITADNTPLTDDEIRLVAALLDPVAWGETYLTNRDGSPRGYWEHQKGDLRCEDKNVIHLDGRDVGKSINLTTEALHYAFTTRGGQGLVAAPQQGHLDNILEEIEFQIDASEVLQNSIAVNSQGKLKIARKPYHRIEFKNGAILYFRPAGPYGDAFRSLHVLRVWVDEGAWITETAWKALRQCLKKGGRLKIYSTPSGIRNTTYYRLTTDKKAGFTVFRWPSWINPNWDTERERELVDFYGGKETAGWQHEVAGEHGKPAYGAFDIEAFHACREELYEYQKIVITGDDLSGCETEDEVWERLEIMLNLFPDTGVFWIGGDLGYTNDPSEIVVGKETTDGGQLKIVARLHLEHVAYPYICMIIALLDRYFSPAGIGVDNGGNGLSVVQDLVSLDRYRELDLESRLRGFDFGGVTVLPRTEGDVKKRTKELMTSLLNGDMRRRKIVFPAGDTELEDQIMTQTYTLNNGNVVYSKGNDHILDALRCLALIKEISHIEDAVSATMVNVLPVATTRQFD